jgi:hypothetical protein
MLLLIKNIIWLFFTVLLFQHHIKINLDYYFFIYIFILTLIFNSYLIFIPFIIIIKHLLSFDLYQVLVTS